MYIEFVARPESEELQVCCMPSAVNSGDPLALAARIVVVFTKRAEAAADLNLARFLAVSDTRIWLVCPITPTLLGRLRLERFIRFVRKCARAVPADTLNRLRILAYPCTAGADPVEEFTCTWAVVLLRTRWWRPWGRGVGGAIISQADGPSLIL